MNECPHCGESLDREAQSCPYCGSDFETGWNPDADYLSVDLPDDDDFPAELEAGPPPKEVSPDNFVGALSIVLAGLLFLSVTFRFEGGTAAILAAALLGGCVWFFHRKLGGGRR
jgi:hypothetical protein